MTSLRSSPMASRARFSATTFVAGSAVAAQPPVLAAEGLVKRYGSTKALDGFDLNVAPGEIVGLVGHNGAGKTTFVEVVAGLVRPEAGRVHIGGVDALRDSRLARRLIGMAPQEQALYVSATVRDNLRLFGALTGLRGAALRAAIGQVAAELRLTEVLDRLVGLLSGGQRRRTQAATALIGRPRLLLLDEPTAGADPETRAAMLAAVLARAADGAAVLYTTHYLPELEDLGATLAVARAGRIIARGDQQSLTRGLPGELRLRLRAASASALAADSAPGAPLPAALPVQLAGRASYCAGGELRIESTDPPADLAALLTAGCVPASVDVRRPDLDDLYRSLGAVWPVCAGADGRRDDARVSQDPSDIR